MTVDKLFLIVISAISLATSIMALVLTYRQKLRQDDLGGRKTLSDILAEIIETNIEMAKIRNEPLSEGVMQLRRALNSQRRYLCQHADVLSKEIPALCYDIDHIVIAGAMDASGDLEGADRHWQAGIAKSVAPITKCYNLRGHARFLIASGKVEAARDLFAQALQSTPGDDDRSRRERADSRVLWALAEREFGFEEEAVRLKDQAIVEAKRIGQAASREDMLNYIHVHWQMPVAAVEQDKALLLNPCA
jgi:hypothetical protein